MPRCGACGGEWAREGSQFCPFCGERLSLVEALRKDKPARRKRRRKKRPVVAVAAVAEPPKPRLPISHAGATRPKRPPLRKFARRMMGGKVRLVRALQSWASSSTSDGPDGPVGPEDEQQQQRHTAQGRMVLFGGALRVRGEFWRGRLEFDAPADELWLRAHHPGSCARVCERVRTHELAAWLGTDGDWMRPGRARDGCHYVAAHWEGLWRGLMRRVRADGTLERRFHRAGVLLARPLYFGAQREQALVTLRLEPSGAVSGSAQALGLSATLSRTGAEQRARDWFGAPSLEAALRDPALRQALGARLATRLWRAHTDRGEELLFEGQAPAGRRLASAEDEALRRAALRARRLSFVRRGDERLAADGEADRVGHLSATERLEEAAARGRAALQAAGGPRRASALLRTAAALTFMRAEAHDHVELAARTFRGVRLRPRTMVVSWVGFGSGASTGASGDEEEAVDGVLTSATEPLTGLQGRLFLTAAEVERVSGRPFRPPFREAVAAVWDRLEVRFRSERNGMVLLGVSSGRVV